MKQAIAGHGPELERARVEGALAKYPNIDSDETAWLIRWFKKEASAHDVALVASNEAIHGAYTLFRREHVDRFTLKDIGIALAFAAACMLAVAGIVLLGK